MSIRWSFLALLLAPLLAAGSPAPAERPDVVLIVWNDPNLERIGFLRAPDDPGGVTPRLDALFADGACFPGGTLVGPRGRATSATVLSGLHTHQTGVYSQKGPKSVVPEGSLGVRLREQGYTGLFVGKLREGPPERFGFEHALEEVVENGSEAVTSFVAASAERPLFVWWEPEVPDGYGAKNLDDALAELLAALDARGRRASTLFAFLVNGVPKGMEFSARDCSASRMQAPIALAWSGKIAAGVHAERVTPLDLFPTLLDLAGVGVPDGVPGRSLRALLEGGEWEPRAIGASFYSLQPDTGSRVAHELARNLKALVFLDGRWKYTLYFEDIGVKVDRVTELVQIERSAGDQTLFDLEADPLEASDLFASGAHAERLSAMREAALAWWRATGGPELVLPFLPPPLGPPPEDARPNIVLVVADDMDYEHLGFLGNPRVKTPTLDELARSGVVFPVAHVPMSRCRPSLATLLSGRWPHQHGIFENESERTLTRRDSLPNLLKAAGYATFQGGKFWEGSQLSMGFLEPRASDTIFQRFVRESQDELFAFIDRYHAERPFFLWWAPMLPHGPFHPPERYRALFADVEVPVPERIEGDPGAYQAAERTAYAMGAWFDDGLAALREKLAATGELEDTLFLFLIDNGYVNGDPSKGTVFEKGLRTPVVVSWPKGIAGGRTSSELVSSIDLYRTILGYAGVPAPAGAGGIDLRPALEGRPLAAREALYGAVYSYRERTGRQRPENAVFALYARTPRWKFVYYLRSVEPENTLVFHEFAPFPARERGERDLYDLEHDPYEQRDLSGDPAHAERMDELLAGALAWWKESGGGELDLPGGADEPPARNRKRGRQK